MLDDDDDDMAELEQALAGLAPLSASLSRAVSYLGPAAGGGGLSRSLSSVSYIGGSTSLPRAVSGALAGGAGRAAAAPGGLAGSAPRPGAPGPALSRTSTNLGSQLGSLSRGSLLSPRGAAQRSSAASSPSSIGTAPTTAAGAGGTTKRGGGESDVDDDLDFLLEELAGPVASAEVAAPAAEPRRVGGPLAVKQGERLHLRVFVDHSVVEVFASSGEVLSTRIYRGERAEHATEPEISFVAFGGAAHVVRCSAYEMSGAWQTEALAPIAAAAAKQAQQREDAAAAAAAASAAAHEEQKAWVPLDPTQTVASPHAPMTAAATAERPAAEAMFEDLVAV